MTQLTLNFKTKHYFFSEYRGACEEQTLYTQKKQSLGLPSYRFRILDLVTRQLRLHTVKHYQSVKHEQTLTFQRAQTIVS